MSTRPSALELEPTRLALRDMIGESLAGIVQRPARTVLTALGTTLGVGAFVAILGLTSTASGQISADFSVLSATQVTINDAQANADPSEFPAPSAFPDDSDSIISGLNGVVHAGRTWLVGGDGQSVAPRFAPDSPVLEMSVQAASPGYLEALAPTLGSGELYNSFHEQGTVNVAVLGAAAAQQLNITSAVNQPVVFIAGAPFTVVGIMSDVGREPAVLLSIFIPTSAAVNAFGPPNAGDSESMLIETRLGAAALIAHQAAIALRPDIPQLLQVIPPADPHSLKDKVVDSLNSLFLILAAITLGIGAIGIANTTLVAVIERTPEIGLRRALGARGRQIAGQFLTETTAIGTVGGLVGTALGVGTVVAVALVHSWTAVLDPTVTLLAPSWARRLGCWPASTQHFGRRALSRWLRYDADRRRTNAHATCDALI